MSGSKTGSMWEWVSVVLASVRGLMFGWVFELGELEVEAVSEILTLLIGLPLGPPAYASVHPYSPEEPVLQWL